MNKFSIANTTKEEREAIVQRSISCGSGCEFCSGCGVFGAGDPFDMYQPYIDGEKELAQINMEFNERYTIKGR